VTPSGNGPPGAGKPAARPGNPRREITVVQGRRGRRWRR
jgi:hypothetical protein